MSPFTQQFRRSALITAAASLAVAIGLPTMMRAQQPVASPSPPPPPYLAAFPNFAPALTANMPGDVDIDLKKQLEAQGAFPKVQREFDLNAW
jgi:hypothetical protein